MSGATHIKMEVFLHSRSRFCLVGVPFLQRFLVPCPEGRQPEVLRAAWRAFEPVYEATKLVSMPSVVWIHFGEGYVQRGRDGHTLDRLQDREVAFRLVGGQEEPLHEIGRASCRERGDELAVSESDRREQLDTEEISSM